MAPVPSHEYGLENLYGTVSLNGVVPSSRRYSAAIANQLRFLRHLESGFAPLQAAGGRKERADDFAGGGFRLLRAHEAERSKLYGIAAHYSVVRCFAAVAYEPRAACRGAVHELNKTDLSRLRVECSLPTARGVRRPTGFEPPEFRSGAHPTGRRCSMSSAQ